MMSSVVLSIGANSGNVEKSIDQVVVDIAKNIGVVKLLSSKYRNRAEGFDSDNEFINIAVVVETTLSPRQLLDVIWEIESSYGRKKELIVEKDQKRVYSDRAMDIDIIFYGDLIFSDRYLTIPHSQMHKRAFVLIPLAEIAPEIVHPQLKVTVKQLKDRLWKSI